jgi:hypothetical protein
MPDSAEPVVRGDEESVPGFDQFGAVEPDAQALKERKAYARGDLQRHEEKKQAVHSVSILFLQLFALALCIVFLIRIYHLITPLSWRWLDRDDIQTLDYLLFSGVIGGIIGGHLKQIFGLPE